MIYKSDIPKIAITIFNSLFIGIIIFLLIHETMHVYDISKTSKIKEVCYLGIDEDGFGGWVLAEKMPNKENLELRANATATILTIILLSIYVFNMLNILDAF